MEITWYGHSCFRVTERSMPTVVVDPYDHHSVGFKPLKLKGDIVAIAVELTAAGSAGTLTVGATADGTEDADTTMTITTGTGHYKRIPRGKARIAAGAELGCEITSDGSWNGTTADMNAVVYVLHYLEGI